MRCSCVKKSCARYESRNTSLCSRFVSLFPISSEFYASLGPAAITSDGATSSAASSPTPGAEKAAQPEAEAPASPKSDGVNRAPPLKSAVIYVSSGKSAGKRRYYLDLKENK